jgi:inosine-uridine nucleoside N-ribohydrolase
MAPWTLVADPGVDDAVAMAVLTGLGAVPDLVVAVPGNVDLGHAARNAAGLAALLGWTVPVQTFRAAVRQRGPSGHGTDGLGGQAHRLPRAEPDGPVDVLTRQLLVTGPLSAVGDDVDRLVWMGGAVDRPGNVDGIAEFNAWCDPAAVDRVLRRHAERTAIVPLDVTTQVPMPADELRHPLLADAMRAGERQFVHDAVAAVAWLRPELFDWAARSLRCDDRGALVAVDDRPAAQVALGVDVEAVRETIRAAVAACP